MTEFEEKGWFLSPEGIELLKQQNPEASNVDDLIACAKDTDLRLLSAKGFNKTNEKLTTIPSPCVLQVLEIKNTAMPSAHQAETPRLLSVVFTDGSKKKFKGVEVFGKVDCLK
ncbi:uncharacterized protein EV154DRAFT_431667 [Mucor mucedo]|uniref:uncharacterized protein n=1 Tax=Mucor mucedo TaxID=29922 RepID=UPI00221FF37C|nr:uncharacterized protein EV154DRAFT_431667 [Mucor mucedo]KAI7870691.1 hypothetical protein EV154DRAFT_431667 [Mucor mucedo]